MRLTSPTPLLKQGQLEQRAQICVQLRFDCVHRWRLHNISRSKIVFSCVHTEF